MIPTPRRTTSRASLAAALILTVGGCGLGAEIDREVNPDRDLPSTSAASAGTERPAGVHADELPGGVHADELPEGVPSSVDVRPTEAPSADPKDACPSSGVRMLPGLVEAAMGLRAMTVTLTNCGTKPYTVNGYPSVQVLDEDRETVDVRVLRGPQEITTGVPDPGPHEVTLKPGESATTSLVWRNTVTEADVPAVNAPYLRVATAKGRPAQVLAPDGGIDLGTTGRLGTGAWTKAQDS
ncbi:DUF4232 domain-containing protein [Streptomyces neyagawaensis]|uniref:DUF4232 domain-containing protein n=1 Tax=Streptomyces neyagawaensis TaxID=42238 RepID=UPI0006E3297C|nr:DUF4232 domain-containing protein [Streptomyces neyagawaensis]MCL6732106.1 DUF4232 domain-containing protein [Streptomyces neyagawaensis]MDE1682399.1 DUF4232 domain-containing protein [Streptomyces neyagawaensis]